MPYLTIKKQVFFLKKILFYHNKKVVFNLTIIYPYPGIFFFFF